MANLGSIGVDSNRGTTNSSLASSGPMFQNAYGGSYNYRATMTGALYQTFGVWSPAAPATFVSGHVYENSVAAVGKRVILLDSNGDQFLGQAFSDATGFYTINAKGKAKVVVIAFDPPTFNLLGYDVVVPV